MRHGGKTSLRKLLMYVLAALFFVSGLGIFLYPRLSDWWNACRNARLFTAYEQQLKTLSEADYEAMWAAVAVYNQKHRVNVIADDPFIRGTKAQEPLKQEYESLLNLRGDGVMGYIAIPKISLKLPIYHGLGEEALHRGVGHMPGTSLPAGMSDTHVVLAGHRGLPSARLFTDLDQLKPGDSFELGILNKKFNYKIVRIDTVLPDETESLAIEPGKDLVSLVTCTPYGVNTHRLLIHAARAD